MFYQFKKSEPRWINFENPKGEKGKGATENGGAKGHAWEHFYIDEEKVLCDFDGQGVIRRIWITLSDRDIHTLQNVYIKMFWDTSPVPQVDVPIGDFFCMGLGYMRSFENQFFSTAEGRSFSCFIPMPFKKHAKIVLHNKTGKYINNLFYDINLTLETLQQDDMLFFASFHELENELEDNVEILNTKGKGRFLGANIAVIPNNEKYGDVWWGEGEVKIFIDGDKKHPTLAGTGAEDYVGSAWELGEFINASQGCVSRVGNSVSMYRFHTNDPIFFKEDIKVELQAMGGGRFDKVKPLIDNKAPVSLVTYDDGDVHHIYKREPSDLSGYINFFRQDHYRTVAYYYKNE